MESNWLDSLAPDKRCCVLEQMAAIRQKATKLIETSRSQSQLSFNQISIGGHLYDCYLHA